MKVKLNWLENISDLEYSKVGHIISAFVEIDIEHLMTLILIFTEGKFNILEK